MCFLQESLRTVDVVAFSENSMQAPILFDTDNVCPLSDCPEAGEATCPIFEQCDKKEYCTTYGL